jgi:hypothetical protein
MATAQEVILAETFERLSTEATTAAALLGLANVPLGSDEASELIGIAIGEPTVVAGALRELERHGLVQLSYGGRLKLHEAFRPLAHGRLRQFGDEVADQARGALRDLLFRSLQEERDLGRLGQWLRLLAQTGHVDTLVDLATEEWFHEVGDPGDLKTVLEAAADTMELTAEERFWALDALVLWDYQDRQYSRLPELVGRMATLVETNELGPRQQLSLWMKQMLVAGQTGDQTGIETAFAAGSCLARDEPPLMHILRYDYALALYHAGAYDKAEDAAIELVRDYYEHLGIEPADIFARNPPEIFALLQDTPTRRDDLKHLADCLDLYAGARLQRGEPSGLARLHAMKFYEMSGAYRSAVRIGQEAVDEVLGFNDTVGARQIMEGHLLPLIRSVRLIDLLVQVRSQYAVVLAWDGDIEAARAEMAAIEPFDVSPERRLEMENQRAVIEEIAAGRLQLPPRTPPTGGSSNS